MKKTNVLQFICSTGFYGAERWVLALANNLDSDNFNTELAVTMEPEQNRLEVVNHFKGKSHEIPMKNRFDLSVVSRLSKLIKDNNIDIIHTHGYKSDILGLLAAKKAGIKSVATPHGFDGSESLKLWLFGELGDFCLRFYDRVVPLSEKLLAHAKKKGVPDAKLQLIQNGVDLKEVDAHLVNKKPSSSDIKKIGFIGQMIPRKNVSHILEIFDNISQAHNGIELILLGDGEVRKSLEEEASRLSSAKNIKFLGFRNDRLEILSQFDMFVMASSYEGIPRCLMEAMAMEVPVTAYDIPGIDKLITSKNTGLLAPLNDKDALTAHWETILFKKDIASSIGKKGREFVVSNFSAARMAKEYEHLFDQLLKSLD